MSDGYDPKAVKKRVRKLVREVEDGRYTKDILPNASYDLTGERQSAYFSHARENMKTDLAHAVMEHGQDLADCNISDILKGQADG